MKRLTEVALRHRRIVALVWVALTVCGVLEVGSANSGMTHSQATPGLPGYDTNAALFKRFGLDGNEQPVIAVLHLPANASMNTSTGRALAARTFQAANRAGHVGLADYANTNNPTLISRDARTTWALIDMPNPDAGPYVGAYERIEPALKAATPPGATLTLTGFEQLQSSGGGGRGGPSVLAETLIGAAGALLVLAFVFGSWIAVIPLLMALPTILTTFLLVAGLEQLTSVSNLVQYLVALIGLGVAIDYSLLVVTRWREEREGGLENDDAIIAAGSAAGRAVVLSGLTVAVGLFSLVVLPVQFLRSIGYGGMLIPLVAICAATTLLPVTLAAWGQRLDRHRVRKGSTTVSHAWVRWAGLVVRRRWIAGLAGLVIVVGLAIPALSLNTGQDRANSLGGSSPAAKALHGLEREGVPSAVVFPIQILASGGAAGVEQTAAIAQHTPGVYTVLSPATARFRSAEKALLSVIPTSDGSSSAGQATVTRLRLALAHVPGGVRVGGNTAQNIDFNSAVYGNFPLMLALIAILTFLLLARSFRSVALALKAVVLNVLSLGASYGFLVLFWQLGHGSNLIYGVPAVGGIRAFIPILVFAFLFGLSMDYEVFVLARIREEYDRTGDTARSIVAALGKTGRLVTCAALILAISFVSLSTQPDIVVRIIATGLAFGIVLDALVVRSLLVPALVALMGRWNWWMPDTLARLLRVPAQTPEPALEAA